LTFDDGTIDTFQLAWPVLRRYGRTATVFLVTDLMGRVLGPPEAPVPLMDWGQVREMAQEGIEFGSHTATHLDLRHAELDAIREELRRSKAAIEEQTGTEVASFAYPSATSGRRCRNCWRRRGTNGRCWGDLRSNTSATRPYELRRIPVLGSDSWSAWRRQAGGAGAWKYYTTKLRQELSWQWKRARGRAGAEQTDGR